MSSGTADGFRELVRMAQRTLERDPSLSYGNDGRWDDVTISGCLAGPRGVSGMLGRVGGIDVLWHKECSRLAGQGHDVGSVPRCPECKKYYRKGVEKRAHTLSQADVPSGTRYMNMGSAAKVSSAQVAFATRVESPS